ncbi:thiamine pyrophosphate-dependent dehydrogenase E1 component subunit alpha [Acidobacterium sp. S8]|uniref:thiamine pyrophosphate-dependent dehydrogenase E1 component subunit alpha n=1 Tax=Acidobacterium sp. S8 TaxID=1641854 RepID=UPI00131DD83C|nr:thiamine pyrophosphate-dependent dehydrogenase E1 component subunit alpha [Acidobacterium sp. S8]
MARASTADSTSIGKHSKELVLRLYRTMVLIREFELKAKEVFRSGRMPGFIHVYIGEEAVATGVCGQLRKDDYVASTHRGHGHALAKGISARDAMAELMGVVTGCSGGRGGTMHLYDPTVGFLGSNGVVPPGILIATGAGLSAKLKGGDQVAVAFFGDGGSNNGAFHEGLNMAATWDIPVIFVCENNMYATEMPFAKATKNTNIASRAAAYGIPGVQVDGNNVLEVYEKTGEAVARARRGEGPTLIECLTYRWFGHHEGDPGVAYRTKEEIAAWKARDPIQKLHDDAIAAKLASEQEFKQIDVDIKGELEDAAEFALSSPLEKNETALDHVYFNPAAD